VTDDRQTDHATEKCVGVGGIACAARGISSNKVQQLKQRYNARNMAQPVFENTYFTFFQISKKNMTFYVFLK